MYSRQNPSPRYLELVGLYRQAHEHGQPAYGNSPEETFAGAVRVQHASRISFLVKTTGSKRLLDYGSGKGRQYETDDAGGGADIKSVYGADEIVCYDPVYAPFSALPDGPFDGVMCLDVIEHCPEEDIPWILDEIIGFADKFAYMTIACFPAVKALANGENAHCTVRPPAWWRLALAEAASRHPDVSVEAVLQEKDFERGIIREHVFDLNL